MGKIKSLAGQYRFEINFKVGGFHDKDRIGHHEHIIVIHNIKVDSPDAARLALADLDAQIEAQILLLLRTERRLKSLQFFPDDDPDRFVQFEGDPSYGVNILEVMTDDGKCTSFVVKSASEFMDFVNFCRIVAPEQFRKAELAEAAAQQRNSSFTNSSQIYFVDGEVEFASGSNCNAGYVETTELKHRIKLGDSNHKTGAQPSHDDLWTARRLIDRAAKLASECQYIKTYGQDYPGFAGAISFVEKAYSFGIPGEVFTGSMHSIAKLRSMAHALDHYVPFPFVTPKEPNLQTPLLGKSPIIVHAFKRDINVVHPQQEAEDDKQQEEDTLESCFTVLRNIFKC